MTKFIGSINETSFIPINILVDIIEKRKTKQRYNLHYIVRKEGYKLITKQKTIYTHHKNVSKSVKTLSEKFGYGIQLEIF